MNPGLCVNPYHISIAVRELDLFLANFIRTTDPDEPPTGDESEEAISGTGVFTAFELKTLTRPSIITMVNGALQLPNIKVEPSTPGYPEYQSTPQHSPNVYPSGPSSGATIGDGQEPAHKRQRHISAGSNDSLADELAPHMVARGGTTSQQQQAVPIAVKITGGGGPPNVKPVAVEPQLLQQQQPSFVPVSLPIQAYYSALQQQQSNGGSGKPALTAQSIAQQQEPVTILSPERAQTLAAGLLRSPVKQFAIAGRHPSGSGVAVPKPMQPTAATVAGFPTGLERHSSGNPPTFLIQHGPNGQTTVQTAAAQLHFQSISPSHGLPGFVSPILFASPLTTPRNTPRSTPIPHRLLMEDVSNSASDYNHIIQQLFAGGLGGLDGAGTSAGPDHVLLPEVSDQFLRFINSNQPLGVYNSAGAVPRPQQQETLGLSVQPATQSHQLAHSSTSPSNQPDSTTETDGGVK